MPLLKTLSTNVVPANAASPSGPGSATNMVGLVVAIASDGPDTVRSLSRSMLPVDIADSFLTCARSARDRRVHVACNKQPHYPPRRAQSRRSPEGNLTSMCGSEHRQAV